MNRILLTAKVAFFLASVLAAVLAVPARAELIITTVFDGPLPGGTPKGIELYVTDDITDLSIYAVGSANNGGGSDGEEFFLPSEPASAGDFLYVASEDVEFTNFFGFFPTYVSGSMLINGDDAIELFRNGEVVDTFGDINLDGSDQLWEYTDGWASRDNGTGPDRSTFMMDSWTFSGPSALDGESVNDMALNPVPIGAFEPSESAVALEAGDADQDFDFDQMDLVRVQIANKYLSAQPATWGEGDWDAAPGGSQGNPPTGNGFFDQLDVVAALTSSVYLTGPYGALSGPGAKSSGGRFNAVRSVESDASETHQQLTLTDADAAIVSETGKPSPVSAHAIDVEDAVHLANAAESSRLDTLTDGSANQLEMGELLGHDTLSSLSAEGGLDATNHSFVAVPEPTGLDLVVIGLVCVFAAACCCAERRKRYVRLP